MPTTSNFGWTTPADTDLVKDGAAAIRTLGNGIDTSLLDLKGGTSGQVLSKNSNTDLDYTWVTPNVGDITEVQAGTGISVASGTGPIPVVTNTVATAIDAKGDLIVGTGADTFARLAVGTNGHTLVADSSVSPTGLKWAAPSAGALTKITTATLSSNTATWDIDNVFSTTYENYLVIMQIKTDQDLNFRWLKSGTAQTTSYFQNYFRVNNGGLTGSDVGDTQHYLISGADADGGNNNFALGELRIGRVGISSGNCGNLMSRMAGGLGGQNTFNGNRIFGSAITITGFRLLTSSTRIFSGSTLTVYGLEK